MSYRASKNIGGFNNMETKNIIILDSNEKDGKELSERLKEESGINVGGVFNNVDSALNYIKQNKVDLVISDVILQNSDGYEFLEHIRRDNILIKVLMLSAVAGDTFVQKAMDLGADYYMIKPYNYRVLVARIREMIDDKSVVMKKVSQSKTSDNRVVKNIDGRLSNIFITVGIPAHIKGYQFLREAIKMAIDSPEIINSITKKLYPSIAQKFDTSSSKVERAIRHAIEVAWKRGKIENINSLFGIKVYSDNEKPTNGEFIALVADKMLIEGA